MYAKTYDAWLRVGWDAWMLGAEASLVAGLRLTQIAAGGEKAAQEARLMVTEKVDALLELQRAAMAGRLGATSLTGTRRTLRHYRRKVAANRRRLTS